AHRLRWRGCRRPPHRALARLRGSPSTLVRDRLYPRLSRNAAALAAFPRLLRRRHDRRAARRLALGDFGIEPERRRLPRRDLARLDPGGAAWTDRGGPRARPALRPAHAARRRPAGLAHRHSADGL